MGTLPECQICSGASTMVDSQICRYPQQLSRISHAYLHLAWLAGGWSAGAELKNENICKN